MVSFPLYELMSGTDDKESPSLQEYKNLLEKGSEETKIETLKKILVTMLNGDSMPGLLMHIIRFIMPSKNKNLKKLLLIYWEICPKTNPDGKLKQEMVLVCNALRNDLLHPNEYIRGNTLRYLCKLKEAEILEPLIPSVRTCLTHKHPYVRRHAVFAVKRIYENFQHLIPDAPELAEQFLASESDLGAKRNAFLMLMSTSLQKAVAYFHTVPFALFDPFMQLAIIEMIRKDFKSPTADKAKYIQCIFSLLHSSSHAVKYEAANTLVILTFNATAVKAAASCYVELIVKESNNNVKLIVLSKLQQLLDKNERMLDNLVMDVLRVLNSPDIDVRKKSLDIATQMISSRNVADVVAFLKKELLKTHDRDYEKNNEYRQILIQTIHYCAMQFSEVTDSVVYVLLDFVSDSTQMAAVDVISFVREVMEKFPNQRSMIITRLLDTFGQIKNGRVLRGVLWIIGEYSLDLESMHAALETIRKSLGEIPILESEQALKEAANAGEEGSSPQSAIVPERERKRILEDGTYATESAFVSAASPTLLAHQSHKPNLRALILSGDYFLGSVLATSLVKIALRFSDLSQDASRAHAVKSEAMLIMSSIIRVGKSEFSSAVIDEDSLDRILLCLRALSVHDDVAKNVFLKQCRHAFAVIISENDTKLKKEKKASQDQSIIQVDDVLTFRQLKSKKGGSVAEDEYDLDLHRATGLNESGHGLTSKLNHIIPLTGYSDSVFAEAYVHVHQFDILLDIMLVNQTDKTLQNLSVEFSTLGDLKLVERPTSQTIGPHGYYSFKANIKVSSTEMGVIFGNIVYEGTSALDMQYITLNPIHIDIMDYIKPAKCAELKFRGMWTEFEWENKINVNAVCKDLREFLDLLLKSTNMACLTPENALVGECGFLAANLYAKSIFGEDALANVSLEMLEEGKIVGHVRIRSKMQGIALSLGDKITLLQKTLK